MFRDKVSSSKSPYYHDKLNFSVSLNEIEGDVQSMAFVVFTRCDERVDQFRRKAVRLMDPATKVELTLFPYRMDATDVRSAWIVAGMIH
jgi:stress response protein SCP2